MHQVLLCVADSIKALLLMCMRMVRDRAQAISVVLCFSVAITFHPPHYTLIACIMKLYNASLR